MRPTASPGRSEPLRRLREHLSSRPRVLPFAEAVLRQAGQPLGGSEDADRESCTADLVCDLLDRAEEKVRSDPGQMEGARLHEALGSDPLLLAAVFQNVDLLYQADASEADVVGRWVMSAIESLGVARPDHGSDDRPAPTEDS